MPFMKTVSIAGKIGRALGQIIFAVTSIISLVTRKSKKTYAKIADTERHSVMVHLDGVVIAEHDGLTKSEVNRIVNAINLLGDLQVTINRVTND